MSRSRTTLAVAATALGVAAGSCALVGARAPNGPTPSPPGCDQALTIAHVPGHLDPVWHLACAGETTDSGESDGRIPPPSTSIDFAPDDMYTRPYT
jgi:hypothetical protein